MAKPISIARKRILTEEERQQQALDQLTADLADNGAALQKTLDIVRELHDSGLLEAAQSMLKAKESIVKIAVGQATRKPVTNIINNLMGTAGILSEINPELMKKLASSVTTGLNDAEEHLKQHKKTRLRDLMKAMNDPDVNRAMGFGIHFLKGMGKGLSDK
ncbi:DUF1641 domain-containing protein [Paenibacillus farraposensis]|uniref:DUF1641 domain-containing protein n=1 Tax=Paenibacillus farraposensis TaxID=2807095 RepID=A0ABW4DI21_9BACL|nr:DUF1641 domain-containing protein [Paenibacillus farraposensis]MCC3380171.1 DUF1641 domain-containing protein [Paenibacillus farraposensis]